MHETWNLDGKHSLWNPVCLPELPDSYLFPKDVFFLLHCFFLLLDKAGLLEYPPPLLFKLAAEGSTLEAWNQARSSVFVRLNT